MAMQFPCLVQLGARKYFGPLLSIIALSAACPAAALASPDCSHAGPRPSAACTVKIDDCKHTSIFYVLAVLDRGSGLTEDETLSRLNADAASRPWYAKNLKFVRDNLHQIYTNQVNYQKLRAGIAPNMALGLSRLINGCNADTSLN